MSDFLTKLAARTLGVAPVVAPRRLARFESEPVGALGKAPTLEAPAESFSTNASAAPASPTPSPLPRNRDNPPRPPDSFDAARVSPLPALVSAETVAPSPTVRPASPADQSRREVSGEPSADRREIPTSTARVVRTSREPSIPFAVAARREQPAQRRPDPAPAIQVTIGRVDVRAVLRPEPAPASSRPTPATPRLSLGSYLRGRRE